MRYVLFYHSLISDWNHGNAHFLRGVVRELLRRGHDVHVYEPRAAWSVENLIADAGEPALDGYRQAYPELSSVRYNPDTFSLDEALAGADVVLVHEWNDHGLVSAIGRWKGEADRRQATTPVLLFHDTHHRAVSEPAAMAAYDLRHYDGVLAFGDVIRRMVVEHGWAKQAWTWHEAADTSVFNPRRESDAASSPAGDLVWIGNWGDEERTAELYEFLLAPVKRLGLKAAVHGVRYPDHARAALADAGIEYRGWLPNYRAPDVFAEYKLTVHVPRRPYVESLPGIPTIRVFEALACGIPLVTAPWNDSERLFSIGDDFLMVRDGQEMTATVEQLLRDPVQRTALTDHGLQTIRARHTCVHRCDELDAIVNEVTSSRQSSVAAL